MDRIAYIATIGGKQVATFEKSRLGDAETTQIVVDVALERRRAEYNLDGLEILCVAKPESEVDTIVYCAVSRPGGVDGLDHTSKGGKVVRASFEESKLKLDGWTELDKRVVVPAEVARKALERLCPIERLAFAGEYVQPGIRRSVDEVERLAMVDYRHALGKVVLAKAALCGHGNGLEMVEFDPPAVLRVVDSRLQDDVLRWMDEDHCDPIYVVVPLEPHSQFEHGKPFGVHGRTRSRDGSDQTGDIEMADDATQARYRGAPALRDDELVPAAAPAP